MAKWQAKEGAFWLLATLAKSQPRAVADTLPKIIPMITETMCVCACVRVFSCIGAHARLGQHGMVVVCLPPLYWTPWRRCLYAVRFQLSLPPVAYHQDMNPYNNNRYHHRHRSHKTTITIATTITFATAKTVIGNLCQHTKMHSKMF